MLDGGASTPQIIKNILNPLEGTSWMRRHDFS